MSDIKLTDDERGLLRDMLDQLPSEGEARRLYAAVERIVQRRSAVAWDEGRTWGQQHWATNYGINGKVANNPYRQ